MPEVRRFILSTILTLAVLLVVPAAGAQQATTTEIQSQEAPEAADTQDQGQNLAVGDPSNNTEISFFIGGLVGGDITTLIDDGFSLSSTLENGRTYGGRVGYYTFPLGIEGSFAYAKSGLGATLDIDDRTRISLGARVIYAEVNALLIIIPGPVQPFVTGGGGLQSYALNDFAGVDVTKWGWNFGGGIKFNIKRVSLRADVRDHLMSITGADLGVDEELAELLGIGTQTLHNVEISFGLGFRF